MFKLRKARAPKTIFPVKDNQLREIHMNHYEPNSQSSSLDDLHRNTPTPVQLSSPLFPPQPLSEKSCHNIIAKYCNDLDPSNFHESGCAVCGALTPIDKSIPITDVNLDYLNDCDGKFTRQERLSARDPVLPIKGPILEPTCKIICLECEESVRKKKLPKKALANGLWIGDVPDVLKDLTFAEKTLIARVRINRFAVKVESGLYKTRCNIIAFQNQVPQILETLPPPSSDIEETFAVMFIKSKPPTEKDFNEIPLYNVRRKRVEDALQWLKLNHVDYENIFISHENLKQYPENGSPVPIMYISPEDVTTNKHPESTSVNDLEDEEGLTNGQFVAVVHGLTERSQPVKTWTKLAGDALTHLKNDEPLLVLGHTDAAESLFRNPTLYSSAFPWLFPYGMGSIENENRRNKISSKSHKGHLLMYHDKRFQTDRFFPIFAFNHEQIKDSTTAGFVLTKRSSFDEVVNRISKLDQNVLQSITDRYNKGETVKPDTADEINCFQLLNDLDKVAEKVEGSMTSKRQMRNELWSLVSFMGAPSWFITFAPADNFHPLCLYYADTDERFIPRFRTPNNRYILTAQNPVAGARFFHIMVELFLKHVLGVHSDEPGVFGKPSAYYGTVEQQGRLTLHIHMLLWIANSLSPQEIRNRVMNPESDFQQKMIEYLESAHQAEYIESDVEHVAEMVAEQEDIQGFSEPSETLPVPPPPYCECNGDSCLECKMYQDWKLNYNSTVNHILYNANRHVCSKKRCCSNKHKTCKARFPRQVFQTSMVDPSTGAICMKQKEAMLNTCNHMMTYLQRCNSDATSLLSGTAIKSSIAYITDYITKSSLSTHVIFESIKAIIEKFPDFKGGAENAINKSRQLLTKLSNSLISKLEIGSPMACMYLLGNPDHYTSHKFVNLYWRSFVNEVLRTASTDNESVKDIPENYVVIAKGMRASSPVYDYVFRPSKYSNMSLYEWVQQFQRIKGGTQSVDKLMSNSHEDEDEQEYENEFDRYDVDGPVTVGGHKRKRDTDEGQNVIAAYSEMFLEGHPQRETHHPLLLATDEYRDRVPNFLGGALPRRDKGDAEMYAATMLTLFKPWRTGMDLKPETQNWSEAIHYHKFSDKFNQLMDNFNLRYECADARDDFAAQRRLMSGQGSMAPSFPIDEDNCERVEEQMADDEALYASKHLDNTEEDDMDDSFAIMGQKASGYLLQMNAVENLLHRIGWTNLRTVTNTVISSTAKMIDKSLDWSTVLKDKREQILSFRADVCNENYLQNQPLPLTGIDLDYVKAYLNQMRNLVRWKTMEYLQRTYSKDQREIVELKKTITSSFSLNKEQERAFKLITNHATSHTTERLQMYLGGMAGTGKSQVIKAVTKFFEDIGQLGQVVLLAPTGSAAANIGGSTYHSYLAINEHNRQLSQTSLARLRQKIEKVRYIFIDEVSMLSCFDMYRISAQLALLMNENDEPFGGMNMIFAGDFAQLPPPGKTVSLYGRVGNSTTIMGQKNTLGKALWHQTTTVVILRENMRQRSQTVEDAKFRKALENMRYKNCTLQDIEYLHDLASQESVKKRLEDERFRNVSVITALNIHRDRINELGSQRFAAENGLKLASFYSKDCWPGKSQDESIKKRKISQNTRTHNIRQANEKCLNQSLQKIVWGLPPKVTEHRLGNLKLCKGLPILIKHNEATECCVTNGAEAKVVDWIYYTDPDTSKSTLQTLFVELQNPPMPVQIDGLPQNVVPISPETKTIKCEMPDGSVISISRTQVPVIPNFAMTDYCSQGRTRPFNVVHMNHCLTHLSYYTCLSRSATHEGTLILNGINSQTITSTSNNGLSGNIRQEFRELEVLDEISKLRYEGTLPEHIIGNIRRDIITHYRHWKGAFHVPTNVHPALEWSKTSPFVLAPCDNVKWRVISGKKKDNIKPLPIGHRNVQQFIPAQSTPENRLALQQVPISHATVTTNHLHVQNSNMNKALSYNTNVQTAKVQHTHQTTNIQTGPKGMRWDAMDYSCAYDSLFTILWNMWRENKELLGLQNRQMQNEYFHCLIEGFMQHEAGNVSLEYVRDMVRTRLRVLHMDKFPIGHHGVDIKDLLSTIFQYQTGTGLGRETTMCDNCGMHPPSSIQINSNMFVLHPIEGRNADQASSISQMTTEQYASLYLKSMKLNTPCSICASQLAVSKTFDTVPKVLVFHLGIHKMQVSQSIVVELNHQMYTFNLKGLIYFGGFHFTTQVVNNNSEVWYHDGIETVQSCIYQGHLLDKENDSILFTRGRQLCTAIYSIA